MKENNCLILTNKAISGKKSIETLKCNGSSEKRFLATIDQMFLNCTHTFITVWSYPGFCSTIQPDCPISTANVMTCRFESVSASWTDGEKIYSYNYEWGNDTDCPKLHKCCNGQGGTGTCVRADGPEPGKG